MMRYFLAVLIFSFCSLLLQAQSNTYADRWKKIDTLILKEGKNTTAVQEIEALYTLAKKEKQDAQLIRALAYLFSINKDLNEQAVEQNIDKLNNEINTAQEPVKQLLYALLAKQYIDYARANQWKLYGQTKTNTEQKDKITNWSLTTLYLNIQEAFKLALQNSSRLQSIHIDAWKDILTKKDQASKRPTLFDLIAFEAIDYYDQAESLMGYSSNVFQLDNEAYFAVAKTFADQKINSSDSSSFRFQAIQLFQSIIRFHLKDPKPDALIDADIHRFEFLYQHSTLRHKKQAYLDGLQQIANTYPDNATAAMATVKLLSIKKEDSYERWNQTKNPTDKETLVGIVEEAEKIQQHFPKTNAAALAFNLKATIEAPGLSAKTEMVVIPNQPFISFVRYKNISTVHYRIVKIDEAIISKLRLKDSIWTTVFKQKPLTVSSQSLPVFNDHREHSVEIKIDPLDIGYYALIASAQKDFSFNENEMSLQFFQVSRISVLQQKNNYFVLDRETGKPLSHAELEWFEDSRVSRFEQNSHSLGKEISNNDGFVKQPLSDRYWNTSLTIKWKKDKLLIDRFSMYYHYSRQFPNHTNTLILTDRTIYRPGQTVYFKGIVINMDGDGTDHQVLSNQPSTIALIDANGQEKATLSVTTNKFGSYHGQFTIPEGLTGRFSLRDQQFNGYTSFSVEEYKRPSFEIVWNKNEQLKKIGDSVTLSGLIKAYSGNNLNNTKLNYRITRTPVYGWRWYSYAPTVTPMEIMNGKIETDEQGAFSISFEAIEDRSNQATESTNFTINIDATDITGETRSSEKTITLTKQPFRISLDLNKNEYALVDLQQVPISILNFDQQKQTLPISIRLTALTAPDRLLKKRYWEAPDTAVYTANEFVRYFPNDPYMKEDDPETWPKATQVFNKSLTAGTFSIDSSITSGHYRLEIIAQTPSGESIKEKRIFKLNAAKESSSPRYYSNTSYPKKAEPGQSVLVSMRSSADDIYLIKQIDRMYDDLDSNYALVHITNGGFSESIPVFKNDRGGIAVHHAFVKHNRYFSNTTEINVPWSNKELNIEVETFRNTLLPGAKETWSVKVSGQKGEKLAAEMLTSMYDASLDQFQVHQWGFPNLFKELYAVSYGGDNNFRLSSDFLSKQYVPNLKKTSVDYDRFVWSQRSDINQLLAGKANGLLIKDEDQFYVDVPVMAMRATQSLNEVITTPLKIRGKSTLDDKKNQAAPEIQLRKNFSETAFFLPQLQTDKEGKITFSFTLPEALTRWKWQMLAHSNDLASGYAMREIISQKPLMISAQMPRFLREGDHIKLAARVTNLSEKEISGMALLQLIDPEKNQPVDGWFQNIFPSQYFTVAAGQSTAVFFDIQVPFNVNKPVQYRLSAKAGTFTDGEENMLPVLSQRQLVTESMPLFVKGNEHKTLEFSSLKSTSSTTLSHQSLTVEYTPNPAWQAVLALPYLMEYPYECAEQSFNRYYANALASKIANQSPVIKKMVEEWSQSDTSVFISQLQKNQALKAVLLEQTPWVFDAQNESAQRKNIAQLFEQMKLSKELQTAVNRLKKLQNPSGAFSWFDGGEDDRYITQYILTGIARLKKLNALPKESQESILALADAALNYVDQQIRNDHEQLKKDKTDLTKDHLGPLQIQYLYLRAQFNGPIADDSKEAYAYYGQQAKTFWLAKGLMQKAMLAAVFFKKENKEMANKIIQSLEENSITSESLGMYWKNNTVALSWYQSPIETQAILIEAFQSAGKLQAVEQMKCWLLNQKRVQQWPTTTSTADAIYALLLTGKDIIGSTPKIAIRVGNKEINALAQTGTGYIKQVIPGDAVKPEMGTITIKPDANTSTSSWGAVHWQYLEDIDKIKAAATPIQLKRIFFIQRNTDKGPTLIKLEEGAALHVGDKLVVRIELTADRDMEYMHLKDMRPSSTEPVNVLSGYRYKNGLGYYESTRDASSDFFISWLPKGNWVFEYPLLVTHAGRFSAGIATIQSMYAPEFNAHSAGFKVDVEGIGN